MPKKCDQEKALRKIQELTQALLSSIPKHPKMNEKEVCVNISLVNQSGELENQKINVSTDSNYNNDQFQWNQSPEDAWF